MSLKTEHENKLEEISSLTLQMQRLKRSMVWKPQESDSKSAKDYVQLMERLDSQHH
jgi:hypothetical protein